jgi:hypothetical protein
VVADVDFAPGVHVELFSVFFDLTTRGRCYDFKNI